MGTSPAETPKPGGDSGTHDRRVTLRQNVVDSHLVTVDLAFQSGALLLDLSEKGMGVQALSSAPMGATTSLQFDLPETGGRVDAVGRIAWTDSSGRLGIRFEEIAELGRVHLAQWLSRDRRPAAAPGLNAAMPTWPAPYTRDEIAALRRDLTTEKLEGDAALALVVERVRNVTRATGAAIALEDGVAVVCRASSGNAPAIDARLDPNSGLSGECIRTGEIVRCEDTETDPRADRMVCRKLELRSIVIVPVRVQGRPAGVLEAFSSRAHAFQRSDVLLLRRVADLVAGIAVRQPETAAPSITGPQALMAAATLEPLIEEPAVPPETPLMMEDILTVEAAIAPLPSPPVVTKPPAPPRPEKVLAAPPSLPQPRTENMVKAKPGAAPVPPPPVAAPMVHLAARPAVAAPVVSPTPRPAVAAPVQRPAPTPRVVAPVARPAPPPPVVVPVARPAPRQQVVAPVQAPKPGPALETAVAPAQAIRQELATRPAVEIPATLSLAAPREMLTPSPAPTAVMRAMGAAAMAASAAARHRPVPLEPEEDEAADMPGPASMRDAMLANMPGQIPSPWRLRLTGAGILAAVLIVGGWEVWRAISPPNGTPMDSEVRQTKPVVNRPSPLLESSTLTAPPPAVVPMNAVPVAKRPIPAGSVKATKPPAAAKNAAARPAPAPRRPVPTPVVAEVAKAEVPEAPPPMGLERPAGTSAISNVLTAPVAPPTLDKPASELTGGKLIKRYEPEYPSSAAGLNGEVVLKATISKEGKVTQVEVVSGHALLAQAAAAAVKRWRYEPFLPQRRSHRNREHRSWSTSKRPSSRASPKSSLSPKLPAFAPAGVLTCAGHPPDAQLNQRLQQPRRSGRQPGSGSTGAEGCFQHPRSTRSTRGTEGEFKSGNSNQLQLQAGQLSCPAGYLDGRAHRRRQAGAGRRLRHPRTPLPARRSHPLRRLHRRFLQAFAKWRRRRAGSYIVFCGVHFMAESADVLGRAGQVVVLPDLNAGCSMADMAEITQVEDCWEQLVALGLTSDAGEGMTPITYMNSTAAIKAFCGERGGVVCTSSNARGAFDWGFARNEKILFLPDQHLGRNTGYAMGIPLSEMVVWDPFLPQGGLSRSGCAPRKVILWKGHCSVHQRFLPEHVDKVRAQAIRAFA